MKMELIEVNIDNLFSIIIPINNSYLLFYKVPTHQSILNLYIIMEKNIF